MFIITITPLIIIPTMNPITSPIYRGRLDKKVFTASIPADTVFGNVSKKNLLTTSIPFCIALGIVT